MIHMIWWLNWRSEKFVDIVANMLSLDFKLSQLVNMKTLYNMVKGKKKELPIWCFSLQYYITLL